MHSLAIAWLGDAPPLLEVELRLENQTVVRIPVSRSKDGWTFEGPAGSFELVSGVHGNGNSIPLDPNQCIPVENRLKVVLLTPGHHFVRVWDSETDKPIRGPRLRSEEGLSVGSKGYSPGDPRSAGFAGVLVEPSEVATLGGSAAIEVSRRGYSPATVALSEGPILDVELTSSRRDVTIEVTGGITEDLYDVRVGDIHEVMAGPSTLPIRLTIPDALPEEFVVVGRRCKLGSFRTVHRASVTFADDVTVVEVLDRGSEELTDVTLRVEFENPYQSSLPWTVLVLADWHMQHQGVLQSSEFTEVDAGLFEFTAHGVPHGMYEATLLPTGITHEFEVGEGPTVSTLQVPELSVVRLYPVQNSGSPAALDRVGEFLCWPEDRDGWFIPELLPREDHWLFVERPGEYYFESTMFLGEILSSWYRKRAEFELAYVEVQLVPGDQDIQVVVEPEK